MPPKKSPSQRRPHWDTLKRQRILILHNDSHLTISEINKLTYVSRTSVRRIINSDSTRTHENSRSKRLSKLNVRDVRRLVRAVISSADERRASYMKLAEKLKIQASETIIRRVLRKASFRRCVICLKSLISWINRRKRLKWTREHLHWKIEDWLRMIFNDESIFQTSERVRQFVTRRSKERYCSDCLSNFKHSKRESVMMWETICESHVTHLMKLKKIKKKNSKKKFISSIDYIQQILAEHLASWYETFKAHEVRFIFMQDNVFIHESKEIKLWLRQHQIEILKWLSAMNLTKWMWKDCKFKIRRYLRLITNEKKMFEVAYDEWDRLISKKKHVRWINTMKKRCQIVIKNRRFFTKYWISDRSLKCSDV
jgi:glycerol-3-phosphate cytidylyltransferase-like family protein